MTDILIIDDNPEDREWIAELLQSDANFTTTAFDSGVEALRYLEDNQVDCVLLDWHLQGEDGIAVLANLVSSSSFIPVIMISGEGNEALAVQAIKVGASNYITKKDLSAETLINTVQSAVDMMTQTRNSTSEMSKVRRIEVLLVEDNDDDRLHIELMISDVSGGYSVTSFATGTETLAHFNKHGADCIILDYRLESEDGLDILAKLKKISPFIPVIMLTGQGNEEVAAMSIKVGAADYLIKQRLTTTYLHTAINNAVSRSALELKIADQEVQRQRFLSTLVHDLRAPLRNVKQLGMLAVAEAEVGDMKELRGLLTSQSSVASRAADLIDTLESYALLDGEVVFRESSLSEAAEAAKSILRLTLDECKAEVAIHDMPLIHGHLPQLTQLFQNLISNGLKYNESSIPKISIGLEGSSVVVRDNGIGIPEKFLSTVFVPLKRLWGASQYEGTGLGLAICQKIIDRHDGQIWCTSKEGEGSAFHLRFPGMRYR